MKNRILHCLFTVVAAFAAATAFADPTGRPVGAALDYGYATDAFPGFEDLKDDIEPKEEQSWKFWYKAKFDSPRVQYAYAQDLETNGLYKAAAKAYDCLVRKWPACPQAAMAQQHLAESLYRAGDKKASFAEFEYLLQHYAGLSKYRKIVNVQYRIADEIVAEDFSMFGLRLWSNRNNRRRYEKIVRRAPGEVYAPEAMLKIAALRADDGEYMQAISVCESIPVRYPDVPEATNAIYHACKYRRELVNRQEYNAARCVNSVNYMKMQVANNPALDTTGEIRLWIAELEAKIEKDAWARTVFYDTRQRAPQSAIAAYEHFVAAFPESSHAEEAKARAEEIRGGAAPLRR